MEAFWLWLDRATILAAVAGALFSALAWSRSRLLVKRNREREQRSRAPITIRLKCDGNTFDLPYHPRRDQLSRQEVTGLLSFYYGEPRFDPAIVRRVLENGTLDRVLAGDDPGDGDELLEIVVDSQFLDTVKEKSKRDE